MANTYTTKTITWSTGHTTLWAGTPLDANGKPVNDATAIGILAEDLHMPNRSAKVLTAGEWNEDAYKTHGLILSDEVKTKLSNITFTHPPVDMIDGTELATALASYAKTADLTDYVKQTELETTLANYAESSDLAGYVQQTDLATAETAGLVKQAEAVEDLTETPTASDFNGLLQALRDAGVMAAPAEEQTEE